MIPGTGGTTYAASNQQTIDVSGGAKVYIDGGELIPHDAAGTVVKTFVYNGTAYFPALQCNKRING